ncbi:hypothetical protein [Undibacterium sp. TJN19]|uniref:hypothetical protein n=1 Tax=Undibacterium sp. TJN19 TaxID=3413055 RepID=UPI003BEFAB47
MLKIKNGVAELWAVLNPAIDLSEILRGFLQGFDGIAGNEIDRVNQHGAQFDEQQCRFVDARAFDELKQNTQLVRFEHGVEILQNHFSINMPGDNTSPYVTDFLEFCWPGNTPPAKMEVIESGPWALKKNAALTFYGVRNTTWKDPYTSVRLGVAAGALGLHNLHTGALLKVLEQDLTFNGDSPVLAEMHARLAPVHARVFAYELEHAAFFAHRRDVFLSLGMEVLARFSSDKKFLIQEQESASPVDVLTGQATEEENTWLMPDPQALELEAWCDRLGWEGFEYQRAIAYLRHQKQDDQLARKIVSQCISLGKYTWPGLIDVLAEAPISHACQLDIISFLADPNWPGAGEAYDVIQKNLALFSDALQESYQHAQASNDESWIAMIDDLMGRESDA